MNAVEVPSSPDTHTGQDGIESNPAKRIKLLDSDHAATIDRYTRDRQKGLAPIKAEFRLNKLGSRQTSSSIEKSQRSETGGEISEIQPDRRNNSSQVRNAAQGKGDKKKKKGQNKNRSFGSSRDAIQLCSSRMFQPEFSPRECSFGERCRYEHDLRRYLAKGKRPDLKTFDGFCPIWNAKGRCRVGWKCRFANSHSFERVLQNGRKELVLNDKQSVEISPDDTFPDEDQDSGVLNTILPKARIELAKKITKMPKTDAYMETINRVSEGREILSIGGSYKNSTSEDTEASNQQEMRASFVESPLLPSEKRRIYYGPETPILAPLTTQGNLPFRRLCVELGAQVTWSEMAMGMPLLQGEKSEWALVKAHESEVKPPLFLNKGRVVENYDSSKDQRFGVQIAANKPWLACKATEVLTALCPHLRAIDLNCGCPIDLVYQQGAGSALLDSPAKLEKILRGMNYVSGDVPVTVKIRMGTKDNQPTATKLAERLIVGGMEAEYPAGVAAITLHGRSRQQRYTRNADWEYIAQCSALLERLKRQSDDLADTVREKDVRYAANNGHVYFVGNGDCFSHEDYNTHLAQAKVDSVMIARGALIKPWIFEEIEKGQYLDKSARERLEYVEKFVKYGLEVWGSDELGVGTTRRFLLEWLSFSCRYVPVGLLERLPPNIQDRPPAYRGRDDLETLMASDNFKDWIRISEMFLGPAHPDFHFEPKHKSNSYEIDAEG